MNIRNVIRRAACVLALSTCAAAPTLAKDSGFYLGASFGQSKYDVDEQSLHLFPVNTSFSEDEKDWGYSLAFGYRILPYVAVELSLNDYGDLDTNETGFTANNLALGGYANADLGTRGAALSLVGTLPLDKFELFGRVGALRAETTYRGRLAVIFGTGTSALANAKVEKTALLYGVGAGYNIRDSLFLKLEYTMVPKVAEKEVGVFPVDADISQVSFGFQFRF